MNDLDDADIKLEALPFQYVETDGGVILKRGVTQVMIGGKRAAEVIQIISDALHRKSMTKEELTEIFSETERQSVLYLIGELQKRQILIPSGSSSDSETALDVFFWQFGESAKNIDTKFNKQTVVVGVNNISQHLCDLLKSSKFNNIQIIDDPMLHSAVDKVHEIKYRLTDYDEWLRKMEPDDVGCIIVTSDLGAIQPLRKWNKFCVEHDCPFMPVMLNDLVGHVGPIVIPGETACFECFVSRNMSNLSNDERKISKEIMVAEGKRIVGYHPAMASILADVAAMELTKFYSGWTQIFNIGKSIKINMLATNMETHKILKVPRCSICSTLNKRSFFSIMKSPSLNGNENA